MLNNAASHQMSSGGAVSLYLPNVHCCSLLWCSGAYAKWVCSSELFLLASKAVFVHSNQHKLEDDMGNDPKSSSFYMAMCLSEGVLLILDGDATPFKRSWW